MRDSKNAPDRYIVFDTETPNCRNNSICSIAVSIVENGRITEERCDLVDPEARFDPFNIRIHGITPEMVRGEKNFPELWSELAPIFDSGVLVAHNAAFDLGVLSKLFRQYGIHREGDYYACTVRMGRKYMKQVQNHKLDTLCRYLDIPLDHHNAASDSHACAELLRYYMYQGFPVESNISYWEYSCHC